MKMKKNYIAPEIVVYVMDEDVITTSAGIEITDPDINKCGWI